MRIRILSILLLAATSALWCQEEPASGKAVLQQRLAELKASMAANQAQLKKYQWLQTTQVSIKGETKKEEQAQCRYGADGKLQKTPVGAPLARTVASQVHFTSTRKNPGMSRFPCSRFSRSIVLAAFLLALGTADGKSIRMVTSWFNPKYEGKTFHEVLVIGVAQDLNVRADFEDEMAAQIARPGIDTIPGNQLLLRPDPKAKPDVDYLRAQIQSNHIDAVVVSRLLKVDKKVTSIPSSVVLSHQSGAERLVGNQTSRRFFRRDPLSFAPEARVQQDGEGQPHYKSAPHWR